MSRDQYDAADDLDARQVARVFRRTSDHLQHVAYADADGNVERLSTTDEHPFWVEGLGWTAAGDPRAGMTLGDADGAGGSLLRVLSSVREARPEGVAVYNFEVEGDHTSLVEDGVAGGDQAWAWVNNECGGQHHFWPRSCGYNIPYKHKVLEYLPAIEHTHIHAAFSDFLEKQIGRRFNSMSGIDWLALAGSRHGLNKLLHVFHRTYSTTQEGIALAQKLRSGSGLTVYDLFKAEYNYARRKGLL